MNEETRLNVNYDQDEESIINKVRLIGFSKNIKFYSALETIFDIYASIFFNWWYLVLSLMSISGYYGALKYKNKFISVYLVSECIKLFFKFLIPFSANDFYLITISLIMSMLNIIYIRTVYIFRKELKNCNREELDSLRSGWSPRHVSFVFV